ncbi:CP family cyanate transporter-like MFS transporter [Paenibacillus rhizosphaerae]|uniref:CP family cyanate transporter-like MFS transporter n=1 Tax=Paenibacillus rhizosphaerae TaxID=297318 RepID=A0A839TP65_9BACL|nr:MFS transporter [Paenibacillus rhizosphaerae]MBB3128606.1 CP family cyanate transporter-like MFS transporter [Paenibacillus rhizosphaerae]
MNKTFSGGLLIAALFLAALNLRLSINSISPILESIRNDLNMSAWQASLLTTIPVLCMGIFSPLAAKISGRWGLERVISWSLLLIGVGTLLRFVVDSTISLIITAFIAGAGIASVGPLLSGFIKRHFSSNVPSMIAVYTLALTIGAALASGLSAPIQTWLNSWQEGLAIWGILGILAIGVWVLLIRRIKHSTEMGADDKADKGAKIPWGNAKAWLLTLSFGLLAMLFYSVTAWLPPMIQSMGYSKWYAANVLTIFAVVQIPAGLLMRFLLKKIPSRLLWLLVASTVELVGFIMIMFNIQPWIAAMLIGLGAGTLFSLNLLLPIDMTGNPQEAASWAAMTQSVGYVIGAAGPLILGWIHDTTHSFSIAIIGMIAVNLLMIGFQYLAVSKKPKKQAEVNVSNA